MGKWELTIQELQLKKLVIGQTAEPRQPYQIQTSARDHTHTSFLFHILSLGSLTHPSNIFGVRGFSVVP